MQHDMVEKRMAKLNGSQTLVIHGWKTESMQLETSVTQNEYLAKPVGQAARRERTIWQVSSLYMQ